DGVGLAVGLLYRGADAVLQPGEVIADADEVGIGGVRGHARILGERRKRSRRSDASRDPLTTGSSALDALSRPFDCRDALSTAWPGVRRVATDVAPTGVACAVQKKTPAHGGVCRRGWGNLGPGRPGYFRLSSNNS